VDNDKVYWILVRRVGQPDQVLWVDDDTDDLLPGGIGRARLYMEQLLFDDDVLAVRLCEQIACGYECLNYGPEVN
jgi:hypothetical protein